MVTGRAIGSGGGSGGSDLKPQATSSQAHRPFHSHGRMVQGHMHRPSTFLLFPIPIAFGGLARYPQYAQEKQSLPGTCLTPS